MEWVYGALLLGVIILWWLIIDWALYGNDE